MESNKECDKSCDPANTRRQPVTGLDGVKLATEDSTGVGTQAPVTVNATGQNKNKNFVQQVFHAGLFTRPRSPSVGSVLTNNNEEGPQNVSKQADETVKEGDTIHPRWQRVPTNRNSSYKKRKISSILSPEKIVTSNMFDGLPTTDITQQPDKPEEKKPSKPPPIVLYGIENVNNLTEFLETAAESSTFTYKIVNKNQIRIVSNNVTTYKNLITAIREKGLIGHTFNRKDERNCRVVVRNLHHTTPHNAIKAAFEATGNTVVGEIINARFGPDKKPTSTFFVNLQAGPNNKAAKQIRNIFHQLVTIEDPKKRNTIVQCQKCQQYGHTKNYCMRPPRCLKCAESHHTKICPKTDRSTPATCALCLGPHPSNYKGCEVYKEILARKMQQRSHTSEKKSAPPSQLSTKQTYQTPEKSNTIPSSRKKYSEVVKENKAQNNQQPNQEIFQQSLHNRIEEMFIEQSKRIDIILQQMSNMLGLLTTLVNKLSK